jgi:hypothetical protein
MDSVSALKLFLAGAIAVGLRWLSSVHAAAVQPIIE